MSDSTLRDIARRMAEARKAADLTQGDAARMIDMAGASSLSHYETTTRRMPLDVFLKLCALYNISPVWALTGVTPRFDAHAIKKIAERLGADAQRVVDHLTALVYTEHPLLPQDKPSSSTHATRKDNT